MVKQAIFEKPNVLICGGAGFIGSHLADELVKTKKVICIDNFSTGSEANIDHLLPKADFEFVRHNLINPINLEELSELKKFKIKFQGVQEIYNLACPTSPKEYNKVPVETLLANSSAVKNALDLAIKYKAKFLHFSSSAIYGEPLKDTPFQESYWGFIDPIGPRSCYNEGKRFAESMVYHYGQKYKLDAKIIRVFNTFGHRMRLADGRMMPEFVMAALKNKDIVIYGLESATSTFLYVSDLVEATIRMMNSKEKGPLNIGDPTVYLISQIAQKVVGIAKSKSKIVYQDLLPYVAKQGIPDISLAQSKLGWFPVVSLDDGLKNTIEEMRGRSKLIGLNKF